MRTLIAAMIVIASLLASGAADAKRNRSSKVTTSDNDGVSRGKKRTADDPVLRRYGKKATYVAVVDYKSKSKSKAKAKASRVDSDNDDVKPAKMAKKSKAKAVKAPVEEEVIVIEEEPATKTAKKAPAKKPAKKKIVVEDDEEEEDDDDEIKITEG